MGDWVAQGATSLGMTRMVDLAYQADIPLAVDVNMSKVMTFETQLMVLGVVAGERGIDQYAVDSSHSINFLTEFSTLEGQLGFRGEWGRRSRGRGLRVGRRSQFLDVMF